MDHPRNCSCRLLSPGGGGADGQGAEPGKEMGKETGETKCLLIPALLPPPQTSLLSSRRRDSSEGPGFLTNLQNSRRMARYSLPDDHGYYSWNLHHQQPYKADSAITSSLWTRAQRLSVGGAPCPVVVTAGPQDDPDPSAKPSFFCAGNFVPQKSGKMILAV